MNAEEALRDLFAMPVVVGSQATEAVLEEHDPASKIRKIKLTGLRPGDVLIHLDNCYGKCNIETCKINARVPVCRLFSTEAVHAVNCLCDAVLYRSSIQKWILLEIKSGDRGRSTLQLLSVQCLLGHVRQVLHEFYGIDTSTDKLSFGLLRGKLPAEKWLPQISPSSARNPYEIPVTDNQVIPVGLLPGH